MLKTYHHCLQRYLSKLSSFGHLLLGTQVLLSLTNGLWITKGLLFMILGFFLLVLEVLFNASPRLFDDLHIWVNAFDTHYIHLQNHFLLVPSILTFCLFFALLTSGNNHCNYSRYTIIIKILIGYVGISQLVRTLDLYTLLLFVICDPITGLLLPFWGSFVAMSMVKLLIMMFNTLQHPCNDFTPPDKPFKQRLNHHSVYDYMMPLAILFVVFFFSNLPFWLPLQLTQQKVLERGLNGLINIIILVIPLSTLFIFYGRMPQRKFSLLKALRKIYGFLWENFRFTATLTASQAYASAFATPQHQHQTLFWMASFSVSILSSLVTYSLLHTHLPYWQILVYTMAGKALLFSLVLRVINQRLSTPIPFTAWLPWLALGFVTSHTLPTAINTFKFLDTCILKLWGLHDLVRLGLKPLLASPFIANLYTWGQSLGVGITVDLLALGGILWCFWYRDMCYLAHAHPEQQLEKEVIA